MKRILVACLLALLATPVHAAPGRIGIVTSDGSFALWPPSYVDTRVLAANTAEVETIPTYTGTDGNTHSAGYVIFSGNCDFYAAYDAAAAVPSVDVTNGTASELNPTIRYLGSNYTTIGLIAPTTCVITMSFFKGVY